MKNNKQKGFTLIELLAVFVIIAIILAIAVPTIANIIQQSKKVAFELQTELIVKKIKDKKDIDGNYDVTKLGVNNLNEELGINSTNFESIAISYIDKDVAISIVGTAKWKGLQACGTSGKITVGESCQLTVDNPSDENICATGAHLNNSEILNLISEGYIPIASGTELNQINQEGVSLTFGAGTSYSGTYVAGVDKKYIQVKDIDLSGYSSGSGFVPIAYSTDEYFSGFYNGDCYKIKNLTINLPSGDGVGLFSGTDTGANLTKIVVENGNVTGGDNTGGIIGKSNDTNLSYIQYSGNITGSDYVGGLTGEYYSSGYTFNNAYFNGNITGGDYVGGIAGYLGSSILKNVNINGVFTTGEQVGGIVGYINNSIVVNGTAVVNITGTWELGGAFGYILDSRVSNITTAGSISNFDSSGILGGIAGYGINTIIINSRSSVNVNGSGESYATGGIVGSLSTGKVINCSSSGNVTGKYMIGGLVGELYKASIYNSYSTATVTAYAEEAGGLVGEVDKSYIEQSYATGNVTGTTQVGGLVGLNGTSCQIKNSYSTGNVIASKDKIGGLVGENYGGIINSYTVSGISGTSTQAGGLVGLNTGTVSNSFYYKNPNNSIGTKVSSDELKQSATFTGWDFDDIWALNSNYPELRSYNYLQADNIIFDKYAKTIIGYLGSATSINIPAKFAIDNKDYVVEKIAANTFKELNLENVILNENLIEIGDSAFYNNNIINVSLPNSLTTVGERAFYKNNIETLTFGTRLETIGEYAFYYNKIKSLVLPSTIASIGQMAFANNLISTVNIPSSLTVINDGVFCDNKIINLVIPDTVARIGVSAFRNNLISNLSLGTSNNLKSIGEYVFNNNQLPDAQAYIYKRNADGSIDNTYLLSYGGAKRDNITLPANIVTVGIGAFNTQQITSITIPISVNKIEDHALFNNFTLTSITMAKAGVTIGNNLIYYNTYFKDAYKTGGAGTYIGSIYETWKKQ